MILSNKLLSEVSMTASIVSDPVYLHRKIGYAMHFVYTGAPTGAIYISVSIDGINWKVLTDSSTAISAAGDTFYNVTNAGYLVARAHYAFTSGSGSLTVLYSSKEIT